MGLVVKLLLLGWALLWIASQVLGLVERVGGTVGKSAGDARIRLRDMGKIAGRVIFFALIAIVAYLLITRFLIGPRE